MASCNFRNFGQSLCRFCEIQLSRNLTEFVNCNKPHNLLMRSSPADTGVLKTSSGRLKKVTTSYDQTRRPQDVWQKTFYLRRLEDVEFTSSWRRRIYDILKTSDLRRLEDVCSMTSWRRPIYGVLKTSHLRCLEDVWFTTSWRRQIYVFLKTSDLRCLEDVCFTA